MAEYELVVHNDWKPGQRIVNAVNASGASGVLHAILFHVLSNDLKLGVKVH